MFRLIDVGFWDDPQFVGLGAHEMALLAMLFSNIHTQPCGIYRVSINRISAMCRMPEIEAAKILKRLSDIDVAYYDGMEVCIPGYIRRQRYKGPQMATRCAIGLAQAKNQEYVAMIEERYPEFLKLGGYKRGEQINKSTKQLFPDMIIPEPKEKMENPQKSKQSGIEELALEIREKLKLTGGVKKTVLKDLVKAAGGEEQVRAGMERAVKYYATAKGEKWKHFVLARRFSKFCERFGDVFSSDDALESYLSQIRTSNAREEQMMKRAAQASVGVRREPESPEVANRKRREAIQQFLAQLPPELVPFRKSIVGYYAGKVNEMQLIEELAAAFAKDEELMVKTKHFLSTLTKKQRTAEVEMTYRGRYLLGRYHFPAIE